MMPPPVVWNLIYEKAVSLQLRCLILTTKIIIFLEEGKMGFINKLDFCYSFLCVEVINIDPPSIPGKCILHKAVWRLA